MMTVMSQAQDGSPGSATSRGTNSSLKYAYNREIMDYQVDEEYIRDNFNLHGLKEKVQYYK